MNTCIANSEGIQSACSVLSNGGIVVYPTETCYGMACDLRDREAVAKLFACKQRPHHMPVSALFTSLDDALQYVEWPESADAYTQEYPGPITLILPAHSDPPTKLHLLPYGEVNSIGVRVSSHPTAQALVAAFGSPIATTSANVSGQPPAYSIDTIQAQWRALSAKPDLVLDAGELPERPPSKIIDLSGQELRKIR